MNENKSNNTATENNAGSKKGKKTLFILVSVIVAVAVAAVVIAVVLKNNKDKPEPITVTDENGVVVTDISGEPVTVIPETEIYKYTDVDGKEQTSVIYKDITVKVNVPVTDKNGEKVTDANGATVTEEHVYTMKNPESGTQKTESPENSVSDEKVSNEKASDDKAVSDSNTQKPSSGVVGTTAIAVTDGQGNTGVDENGNVLTTIAEITSNPVTVTPADIDWKSSRGGTEADYFSSVAPLTDGGYIAAVVTNSTDGDYAEFAELKYATPFTVLTKYTKSGDIKWQKVLGSRKGLVVITSLVATDDGGFYAAGYGKNIGGENGKGYYDGTVYKFDKNGNEEWHNIFGTSTVDLFNGATLTSDGGVVAVGSVGNNDGDASGFGKPEFQSAACAVKYSKDGKLVWKNILGGNQDSFNGVAEGVDGALYCVGNFYSGELFTCMGASDSGVVKLSENGKFKAVAPIAGKGIESFSGITACKNGGVVIVGRSNSSDVGTTDSMFVSDLAARGGYDAYIIKLNSDLGIAFARAFRGQNDEELTAVVETDDGSFIAAGYSNSSSRDLKGITTRGGNDMVIACFEKSGDLDWARSFGGTAEDSANALCLGTDGGYVVAGKTLSKDIDMKGIAQYVNGKSVGVIVKFPE